MKFTVPGRIRGKGRPPIRSYELMAGDSDLGRASNIASFLCPSSDWLRFIVIEGNPHSKARARVSKNGGFFAPDASAENALRAELKRMFPAPMEGNIGVGCIFFRKDKHRIDVDNMLKHVMDAATKACWHDDSQVTAKLGFVELDASRPRTVIIMGQHKSTMDRSVQPPRVCKQCGKEFSRYGSGPYCSRPCAAHSRGADLSASVECAECGKEFKRTNYLSRLCSEECRLAALRKRNSRDVKPHPGCKGCGAALSKPGYILCRKCWRGARRAA